jgi:hypothetical protein
MYLIDETNGNLTSICYYHFSVSYSIKMRIDLFLSREPDFTRYPMRGILNFPKGFRARHFGVGLGGKNGNE